MEAPQHQLYHTNATVDAIQTTRAEAMMTRSLCSTRRSHIWRTRMLTPTDDAAPNHRPNEDRYCRFDAKISCAVGSRSSGPRIRAPRVCRTTRGQSGRRNRQIGGRRLPAEIPQVTGAAKSAIAMQEALRLTQTNKGDDRIAMRIVIGLGDITFQENDLIGDMLALVVRIEAITRPTRFTSHPPRVSLWPHPRCAPRWLIIFY